MRQARVLIPLLILATVLVDCAAVVGNYVCARTAHTSYRLDMPMALVSSLASSQMDLAAIWAGLGKKSTPWRLTGVFLLAVFWSVLLWVALGERSEDITVETVVMLSEALFVLGPLSLARAFGLRLIADVASVPAAPEVSDLRPLQFTLRDMFAWTTATAIVLGVSKSVLRWQALALCSWVVSGEILLIGTLDGAITLLTLWAGLGKQSWITRIPTFLVVLVGGTIFLIWLTNVPAILVWEVVTMYALSPLLTLASLWVFRVAGYRLAWVRR